MTGWSSARTATPLASSLQAAGSAMRNECRSYERGWILRSFGGRSNYLKLAEGPGLSV